MEISYIQINPKDNVAVALEDLTAGMEIRLNGRTVTLTEDIPSGHKLALQAFNAGDRVIKYGFPIGIALKAIPSGGWVNEHNIHTALSGCQDYTYEPVSSYQSTIPDEHRTFMGYRRKNGEVGIRNEIWIVPTVGCVNGIADNLAARLKAETDLKGIDAVVAFTHNYGCSQLGDDHENTRKILRDVVLHPNAGAVLVIGLGCENNQPAEFRKILGQYDTERIRFMVCQDEKDEMQTGMKLLRELYELVRHDERTPVSLSALRIGLKCGGSDGFSGITANPLLGVLSDYMAAQGATTVMTEVPEMFGAESILMNRCISHEVFEQTVRLINDFKAYFIGQGYPVYENPSPGNKAGGISTLEEKSLGCTQKSGSSPVKAVLAYGDRLSVSGLNLLSAPGNDLVASTVLGAAGCHLVLFTTGRGTPFGTFVPTVKIATNSRLYQYKNNWMDFNAGALLEGESMAQLSARFVDFVIEVASGRRTRNEQLENHEIAIFKTGVTL